MGAVHIPYPTARTSDVSSPSDSRRYRSSAGEHHYRLERGDWNPPPTKQIKGLGDNAYGQGECHAGVMRWMILCYRVKRGDWNPPQERIV
ncbi:hypothetical protein L0F63_006194 [Massospora cicadina]|nr:hypothetical protein L0F63_006194 [Massospora cicadina]